MDTDLVPVDAEKTVAGEAGAAAQRITGKVVDWKANRGFGFVKADEGKKIFVHWKDIETDDSYPKLEKGLEVEFEIKDGDNGRVKGKGKKAFNVSLPGRAKIAIKDLREFSEWGGNTGAIKFYSRRKAFGMITVDEDIEFQGITVKKGSEIYVGREDLIMSDTVKTPNLPTGTQVMFHVCKELHPKAGDTQSLAAAKVTDIHGEPFSQDFVTEIIAKKKRKQMEDGGTDETGKKKKQKLNPEEFEYDTIEYKGKVGHWNARREFGWIKPEIGKLTFKDMDTLNKGVYVHKSHLITAFEKIVVTKGMEIVFKLYKDNRGLGACEVKLADGSEFEQFVKPVAEKTEVIA